jgi:hypothetical protein
MKKKFVIILVSHKSSTLRWHVANEPPRPTPISEGDTQVGMINPPTHHVLVVSVPDQDDKVLFSLATVAKHLPLLARYA